MGYILKIKALQKLPSLELTEEQFLQLKQARTTLSNALMIEESYDLLVSNHEEFEKQITEISVRLMMREEYDYEDLFSIKSVIARRLANVLTAAQIYVDQAPRYYKRLMDSDIEGALATESLRQAHSNSFAYRFMAAYRNHVQHYSAALDSMSLGGVRDKDTMHLAYTVEPYAEKKKLALNPKFKPSVLEEMDAKVDLRRVARGYLACFSKVHLMLRKRAADRVEEAASLIKANLDRYSIALGEATSMVHVIHCVDEREIESFPLLLDWDSARTWLSSINGSLADLERHYVTSQLKAAGPPPSPARSVGQPQQDGLADKTS